MFTPVDIIEETRRVSSSGSLPSDQTDRTDRGISVVILAVRGRSRTAAFVRIRPHLTLILSGLSSAVVQPFSVGCPDMHRQRAARGAKWAQLRAAKEPQHVCFDPPVENRIVRRKGYHTHALCAALADTGMVTRKM